jgi:DNA repair protein RadC
MLTARLKEAGDLFGIPLLDHVVIGRGCYLSMADRGLI